MTRDRSVGAEAAIAGPVRRRRPSGRTRPPLASVALHATLIVASLIAVFPIVWVLLSSFKPGVWVQSSELTLVKEPTLDNYDLRADRDELPAAGCSTR